MVVGMWKEAKAKKASLLSHCPLRPETEPRAGKGMAPAGRPSGVKTFTEERTFSRYPTNTLPPAKEVFSMTASLSGTTSRHCAESRVGFFRSTARMRLFGAFQ